MSRDKLSRQRWTSSKRAARYLQSLAKSKKTGLRKSFYCKHKAKKKKKRISHDELRPIKPLQKTLADFADVLLLLLLLVLLLLTHMARDELHILCEHRRTSSCLPQPPGVLPHSDNQSDFRDSNTEGNLLQGDYAAVLASSVLTISHYCLLLPFPGLHFSHISTAALTPLILLGHIWAKADQCSSQQKEKNHLLSSGTSCHRLEGIYFTN